MKRILMISMLLLIALAGAAQAAHASHGDVGIGLQLGEPTGITGKFWLGGNNAVDATIGWNIISDRFTLQAGYLYHFPLDVPTGALAAYVGVGGLLGGGGYHPDHPHYPEAYILLAGRIPLGLEYIYSPVSFYAELDPLIVLLPEVKLGFGGGIGFRFYF
ncbi:hypothetical protein CEE36_03430 [candidate division TA06 bacterium B3_TA06]|uniref:Outer membrane protein beta-barrel domain-containing protein n=1 Tax=candidate division TA06 bacterium B3_TA06 TaxID=2012487 RepID=A0A532V990_UNCT6|nr:MAG: hypothetical protein CEE36_03430 [candidate division TA06 bacterium B3_TA06]